MIKLSILIMVFNSYISFGQVTSTRHNKINLESEFWYNGKNVANKVQYYLVNELDTLKLNWKNGILEIPDNQIGRVLMYYKGKNFITTSFKFIDIYYLKVYNDRRLIFNKTRHKFFKGKDYWNDVFVRHYIRDYGLDDIEISKLK
jgi:hypothetical protein